MRKTSIFGTIIALFLAFFSRRVRKASSPVVVSRSRLQLSDLYVDLLLLGVELEDLLQPHQALAPLVEHHGRLPVQGHYEVGEGLAQGLRVRVQVQGEVLTIKAVVPPGEEETKLLLYN